MSFKYRSNNEFIAMSNPEDKQKTDKQNTLLAWEMIHFDFKSTTN